MTRLCTIKIPILYHQIQRINWVIPITWCPLNFYVLIFSKTAGLNWSKYGCDTSYMVIFQKCVWWTYLTSKMAAMISDWLNIYKSLNIVRTTGSGETMFGTNTFSMVSFQNDIPWPCQLSKMVVPTNYSTLRFKTFSYVSDVRFKRIFLNFFRPIRCK